MMRAQDIHFSQVDADPMLLNPAYAGFYEGAGRFGMTYRTQWGSVSIPYRTIALTGEVALWRSPSRRSGVSIGMSMFADQAGTLSYGNTSGHLSAAFYTAINRDENSFLSFGIDGGYGISGFNAADAEMEDPSESFPLQQTTYPLLAVGAAWYWQPSSNLHTKLGISARNINRPNISYLRLDDVYLERRYSLFARAEYRRWQSISILPVTMFQTQGQHKEWIYGADLKWYIEEGGLSELSLRAGLAVRHRDAIIANIIMEYNAFIFTFCYDANVSGLSAASQTIGAFEGGLVYRFSSNKKKPKAIKCPRY